MPAKGHEEATWIAFSEVHKEGMKWHITMRQGATKAQIKGMFAAIDEARSQAKAGGFRFPGDGVKAEATPQRESAPRLSTVGMNADDNPLTIGSFKVTGTEKGPVVELYSANKKLKYPVLKVPFSVLEPIVTRTYDVDLSTLGVCGKTGEVDWLAEWEVSEKNPAWKDLVSVTIFKLTPKESEEDIPWESEENLPY